MFRFLPVHFLQQRKVPVVATRVMIVTRILVLFECVRKYNVLHLSYGLKYLFSNPFDIKRLVPSERR